MTRGDQSPNRLISLQVVASVSVRFYGWPAELATHGRVVESGSGDPFNRMETRARSPEGFDLDLPPKSTQYPYHL